MFGSVLMKAKKILVVDDDPTFIELMSTALKQLDFEVVIARDGIEGFHKTIDESPDLVVLDELMPGLSGYQVVKKIRALRQQIHRVPIIVISVKDSMRYLFEEGDIHCFLSKPVDFEEFQKQVRVALAAAPSEDDTDLVLDVDRASGKEMVILAGVEDYIINKMIVRVKSLGYDVKVGLDEADVIEKARKFNPRIILCQFWEDPGILDAELIYRNMQANPSTRAVPFAIFCSGELEVDATKFIERRKVLIYHNSKDFLDKIEVFIRLAYRFR